MKLANNEERLEEEASQGILLKKGFILPFKFLSAYIYLSSCNFLTKRKDFLSFL